ncbi:DUF3313 domain-containing protein [Haloferula sp.]|uniref:DUF3313 domain-containing protein n=1 Tax=Haloferula sp. TaxID=2497595 RepID=UPI00329E57D5
MKNKKIAMSLAALAAIGLSACSTSSPSGFLEDYDQLQSGGNEYGAKLSYTNPETDFKKYDSIQLEPVQFIMPEDSKLTEDDRIRLATAMRDAVRAELSKDYKLVDKPGPSTMTFRGAVTELVPANRAGNVVTSIVPAGRVVAEASQLTTGVSTFSARGTGELELVDSLSRERLVALSDTRYARKKATSSATKWGDIEGAMKRAAADVRKGLAKLRAR